MVDKQPKIDAAMQAEIDALPVRQKIIAAGQAASGKVAAKQ